MANNPTLTIVLDGFSTSDEAQVRVIFENGEHWLEPWQLLDDTEVEQANVVFVSVGEGKSLDSISALQQTHPAKNIIVYTENKPPNTLWHLKKQAHGRMSLLAFSQLLWQIRRTIDGGVTTTSAQEPGLIPIITPIDNTAATVAKTQSNKPSLIATATTVAKDPTPQRAQAEPTKKPGVVNNPSKEPESGITAQTEPVVKTSKHTVANEEDDDEDVLSFLNKISTAIDSGREEKTRFNDPKLNND